MKIARLGFTALGVLALNLAGATSAYAAVFLTAPPHSSVAAYVDPTAGGVVIQMLLAGAVGILGIAGIFWRRIWSRFGRHKGTEHIPGSGDNITEKDSE